VKFGNATYVTDQVIGPAALARAVEERGLGSEQAAVTLEG
jgi:hypothetical protein